MQPLCDAVTELARSMNVKYLKEGEQILVGLEGPFVSRRVTPRELLSGFIGSMVCVEGIITKCNFSYFSLRIFFIGICCVRLLCCLIECSLRKFRAHSTASYR